MHFKKAQHATFFLHVNVQNALQTHINAALFKKKNTIPPKKTNALQLHHKFVHGGRHADYGVNES